MSHTINVMIVDDHEMVRRGLKAYLMTEADINVLGEASSGREAIHLAQELQPDVILMDLIMENGNGIEATADIIHKKPNSKIIILTSYYDDEQVFPAIEAGAISYLLKTASSEDIVNCIRDAYKGQSTIDAKVTSKLMGQMRQKAALHDQLTKRESEVLHCLAQGMTNADIANQLFIGVKTVKTHVSSIFSKLNVLDRTQAAIYAHQHHLFKS